MLVAGPAGKHQLKYIEIVYTTVILGCFKVYTFLYVWGGIQWSRARLLLVNAM